MTLHNLKNSFFVYRTYINGNCSRIGEELGKAGARRGTEWHEFTDQKAASAEGYRRAKLAPNMDNQRARVMFSTDRTEGILRHYYEFFTIPDERIGNRERFILDNWARADVEHTEHGYIVTFWALWDESADEWKGCTYSTERAEFVG